VTIVLPAQERLDFAAVIRSLQFNRQSTISPRYLPGLPDPPDLPDLPGLYWFRSHTIRKP
jgi:hypothetical protein